MSEDDRAVVREALIREGIALAVMAGILWYFGPGKIWLGAAVTRVREWRKADPYEGQVGQFRAEVSRYDHEQAAKQDRGAKRDGGCGCS